MSDPSDTGAVILGLLDKQTGLETEIARLRVENAVMRESVFALLDLVDPDDDWDHHTVTAIRATMTPPASEGAG